MDPPGERRSPSVRNVEIPPPPPPVAARVPMPRVARSSRPPAPPHPRLPIIVAVVAVVLTAVPLALDGLVAEWFADTELPLPLVVLPMALFVYGPALAWWWLASCRVGSGRAVDDAGLFFRATDLGWGPLVWLGCLLGEITVGTVVLLVGIPTASNTTGLQSGDGDATYVATIVVLTVVVAPFAEEIVFRGLVLRGLLGRVGPVSAVLLQAVLFGLAHVDPARGPGNIGLVLILSAAGVVLGGAAYVFRRLGPSIVGHAILNGVVVTLVLSGVLGE